MEPALLTCYLDDSDAETSAVQTIAGYVADTEGWQQFELLAELVCQQYGVNVMHAAEFDRRHGCFKGWTVPHSISFLHAIRDAMLGNILFGISRSIPKATYLSQKAKLGLNPNLSAYGLAFSTISSSLRDEEVLGLGDRVKDEGVAYRVEAGHKNNTDLERFLSVEREAGRFHAGTTIEFVRKTSCRAVQLADFYAFYSRRRANKWYKGAGKLAFFPDVLALHLQDWVPHYTGIIQEPYRLATLERTGETFHVIGLVTPL